MTDHVSRKVVLFLFVLAMTTEVVVAQKFTGDISGTVTDSSGAAVGGATITAENTGTGLQRTALTSDMGSYRIPSLTVGRYKVTVSASGFKTTVQATEVTANAINTVDFTMQVGSNRERIEVSDTA